MPLCHHNPLCRLSTDFHFDIRLYVRGIGARSGYSDLDGVFAMVVDKGNGLVGPLFAIDGYAHLALVCAHLQDVDVVDGFPIAVVDLEPLPIRRQARRKSQFVHIKPKPQE